MSRLKLVTARLPKSPELPDKWRGGRIERFTNYWKGVARDYKEAGEEIVQGCQKRPLKAATLSSVLGALGFAAATNPDERDYNARFVENCLELMCVPDSIRNSNSERWHDDVWKMRSGLNIRRMNLLLCSVMWRDEESSKVGLYNARCDYLKPGYLDIFKDRLVDVGFLGKWWLMEDRMKDFDVNPDEWDELGRPRLEQKL